MFSTGIVKQVQHIDTMIATQNDYYTRPVTHERLCQCVKL